MAASTSRVAAAISRLRSNCRVMLVEPRLLDEVISVTEAMWPNWRSRGVATEDAMVSGLAPGREGETGSSWKATAPDKAMATVRRVVAIGLRMKVSEMFIGAHLRNSQSLAHLTGSAGGSVKILFRQ